ncbi:MAG: signal recognition particle-docking protein FtsY [Promethearchaeota archaeon]
MKKKGLKGVFSNFIKKNLTEEKLESALSELNLLLISNDVAMETADILCSKIKNSLEDLPVGVFSSKQKILFETLTNIVSEILTPEKEVDVVSEIRSKNAKSLPYVILFLGVNGTGKTTTIAKFAHYLKKNDIISVVAAADTFRAAAIEQLQYHAENVGIRMIKHEYKSDPASVAFDAIQHAKAKNVQVVLIDTAGRQVTNKNLMIEMQKIVKVAQPDLIVFVGDSLAGNDALNQAKEFNKHVGIDVNILTKLDADAKGGAALSIAYETKKPIIFIGMGQGYDDLIPFDKEFFISSILEIQE